MDVCTLYRGACVGVNALPEDAALDCADMRVELLAELALAEPTALPSIRSKNPKKSDELMELNVAKHTGVFMHRSTIKRSCTHVGFMVVRQMTFKTDDFYFYTEHGGNKSVTDTNNSSV